MKEITVEVTAQWDPELADYFHRSNNRNPYQLTSEAAFYFGLNTQFAWQPRSVEIRPGDVIIGSFRSVRRIDEDEPRAR
jgi:hypothetical protein